MTSIRIRLLMQLMTMIATTVQAQSINANDTLFLDGNDFYAWCQSNRSIALGYTAGLADEATHSAFVVDSQRPVDSELSDSRADLATRAIRAYCIPKEVILNQVTDVFCAYLRDRPQDRHGLPPILFNDAMMKAWPCKNQ